jgi:protein-tyrosine phosphatase
MKRYQHQRHLSHRLSSSDMKGRRKRHVGQNDVAQNEDGTPFQQIKYKKFAWTHNHENLATELGPALQVIDRARAAKRAILVHCQCGVARSASLVIAYVMHTLKISLDQAYDFVKAKSTSISPNMYLMFQLRDFETHQGLGLDHKSTAHCTTPTLRKCTSMQFTDVHHASKDHLFNTLVKLDYPSTQPPATESIMLSRRSLDDSFYQSYSFRSESPFSNNLPMYL